MFWSKRTACIFIFVLISFFITVFTTNAQMKEENRAVFDGQVVDISSRFLTLARTSIALPKKIKVLDSRGTSVPFETIKKGDDVIVTIDPNGATIQKTSGSRTPGKDRSIPQ
jgi:hypothetical protein